MTNSISLEVVGASFIPTSSC